MSKVRTIEEIEMMAASEPFFGKGITVASGFDLGAKSPLDSRSIVHTIEERDAHVTGNRAYEGMLVYVVADKKTYQYTGTEWREFGFNSQDFQVNVIDSLESDDATKALSARQGKILKGLIDVIEGRVDGIDTALESIYTKEQVDAIKQALEASVAEVAGRVDTVEEAVELLNGGAEQAGSVAHSVAQALVSAKAEANKLVEAAKSELHGTIGAAKYELQAKDSELSAAIENVRTTLEAKDVELNGKITANTEAIAGVNVELAKKATVEALNAEISRAQAAEVALDGRLDVLEGNALQAGSVAHSVAQGVAEAKSHAETKANEALQSAKAYADSKVLEINNSIETIETAIETLEAADIALGGRIDTIDSAYKAADVQVLKDAKVYTDAEIVKVKSSISDLDTAYKAADEVLRGEITTAKDQAIADAEGKIEAAKVEVKAYADNAVADLVDGAPEALNTLKELADALNQNEGAIEGLLEEIGKKANQEDVTSALALKADTATVTAALNLKADKTALDAEVSRAQAAEEALGQRIDDVDASVTLVEGRVDTLCEKLDLQAGELVRIDNIETDIEGLKSELGTAQSDIEGLQTEVNKLKVATNSVKEFVTTDAQTEFELGVTPVEGSVKFFVNGIKYQAKYFSISGTKVVWNGTLFEMPAECDVEISFVAQA